MPPVLDHLCTYSVKMNKNTINWIPRSEYVPDTCSVEILSWKSWIQKLTGVFSENNKKDVLISRLIIGMNRVNTEKHW